MHIVFMLNGKKVWIKGQKGGDQAPLPGPLINR